MIILGIDLSSVCLGYAILDAGTVTTYGHHDLAGPIDARCEAAATEALRLLDAHAPALVVIESPVGKFAKSLIPQARVSGAVLAALRSRRALWHEVPPKAVKVFLAGKGNADKYAMVEAAARLIGANGPTGIRVRHGKVTLTDGNDDVLTEDEADAIGLTLAGAAVRVQRAA